MARRVEAYPGERVALVYRPPFSAFVDELRAGPDDSWLGRATLKGREIGKFKMQRLDEKRRDTEKGW